MEFKFEIDADGSAKLIEALGEDEVLTIPDTWDDHPVRVIGERAFYGRREIRRVRLPKYLKKLEAYAFAECRFLEQIELPEETESIGDYGFYNCIRMKRIELPGTITRMGYGAFRNDTDLTDIHIHVDQGMESRVNVILSETNFEQTVTFHYNDGNESQLVFTEFFYEETANEEARQFNHRTYGTGTLYRNCVSGIGIDYMKYDALFDLAIHRDEPKTVMNLALKRLSHPYELSETARKKYVDHLKSMGGQVLLYLIETKRWNLFPLLTEGDVIPKEVLDQGIAYGQKHGIAEFVSMLMQYKNTHYSSMTKSFEL